MIVLYEHPLSPYVRKVKLALLEKNLPFERRKLLPTEFDTDDFVQLSPRREVPALVDGDTTLFDSTVICEYLEERYPQPPLYPASPAERARVRMLEERADSHFDAAVWALFEVRFFGRASGALADQIVAAGTASIEQHLDRLERELEGREFLTGSIFGIADIANLPHVAGAALLGVKGGPHRPRLGDWVKRARSRPSVKEDEAHVRALMADTSSDALSAASRPRQYRDHRLEWMLAHGGLPVVLEGIEKKSIQFSGG